MMIPYQSFQDYIDTIESLPEFDKPSYFGLPENIERSTQKTISSSVLVQLRILKRANVKGNKFDKDVWAAEMGPLLQLWKKINQVCRSTMIIALTLQCYRFMKVSNVHVTSICFSGC